MSEWEVIYNNNEECQICKELKRNIIEPSISLFSKRDGKIYKLDTCILHCNKSNEIWQVSTTGNSTWNEVLVKEFWRRIRSYRFAVETFSMWEESVKSSENNPESMWSKFIEKAFGIVKPSSPFTFMSIKNDLDNILQKQLGISKPTAEFSEVNEDKEILLFYFLMLQEYKNILGIDSKEIDLDFRKVTFPLVPVIPIEAYISSELPDNHTFWYKGESPEFKNEIRFDESQFLDQSNFYFIKFGNTAIFNSCSFIQDALFELCEFHGNTYFTESKFSAEASFGGSLFVGDAFFNKIELKKKINFQGASFRETFELKTAGITQEDVSLILDEARIHKNCTIDLAGKKIKELSLKSLKLQKDSSLEIKNLKCDLLLVENINNIAQDFVIFNTEINTTLTILNSILNKLRIINCNFSNAEIHIQDSSLTEVEFINIDWGKIRKDRISPFLFKKEPDKARDVYRQLKLALDNQKDHINANEFYALEMKAYKEVLKSKSFGSFYQEKIVFYLHDFTSNFGQDWLKPILLLILLTMGEVGIQLVPNIYIQQLAALFILIIPMVIAIKLLTIIFKLPLPLPSLETLIPFIFGIADFSAYIHTNSITNFLEIFSEIQLIWSIQ